MPPILRRPPLLLAPDLLLKFVLLPRRVFRPLRLLVIIVPALHAPLALRALGAPLLPPPSMPPPPPPRPVPRSLRSEVLGRPPVNGEPALDIVDDERGDEHERAAEQHDGDQEPAEVDDGVVDDGQERGGAGGRVHRLGEGHGRGGRRAGDRAGDPPQRVEVGAQQEELADADADNAGYDLAQDRVAWLGEGGVDGVEFEDGGGTLVEKRGKLVYCLPWTKGELSWETKGKEVHPGGDHIQSFPR